MGRNFSPISSSAARHFNSVVLPLPRCPHKKAWKIAASAPKLEAQSMEPIVLAGDVELGGRVDRQSGIEVRPHLFERLCLVLDDGLLWEINPGCCRFQVCAHRPVSNEKVAEAP
jgi:hypothetical protein